MDALALAVILAVTQTLLPVPRQIANKSAATSERVQSQANPNKTPPAQSQPSVYANGTPSYDPNRNEQGADDAQHPVSISKLPPVMVVPPKRDWVDWGYWVFSGLLVVVGGLQVRLLWRTLSAIRQQADLMKRQAELMERQAVKLDESVAVADRAAIAAQASAGAAKENIEIIINKERARVSVEINLLSLTLPALAHTANYNLRVYGPADAEAYVVSSSLGALITDSPEPPTSGFVEYRMFGIPNVLTKHNPIENRMTFLQPKFTLDQGDIDSVNQGKAFVHFWGCIKYKDVFDRPRETYFRYRWDVSTGLYGGPSGRWIQCGPPEDNRAT